MPFAVPYRPARRRKMKKGFTLIELLVVVLIIGILSAVALPQYKRAVMKSKAVQGIVTLDALDKAQQVYRMETGDYTDKLEDLSISVDTENVSLHKGEGVTSSYGQIWITDGLSLETAWGQNLHRRCIAGNSVGEAVCKSMGGVFYGNHSSGNKYYQLP